MVRWTDSGRGRLYMRRREFITLLRGAVVIWPLDTPAQQSKPRRVGVLILGNADAQSFGAELRAGMREYGYFEGQNIEYVFRSADNNASSLPTLAAELAALKVDVLVALYTPCALAAQQATREIPIVTVSGDPVGLGLVASLSRPGGNITGISLYGRRVARQMRRALSGYASIGAPRGSRSQCRRPILQICSGARPAGGQDGGHRDCARNHGAETR